MTSTAQHETNRATAITGPRVAPPAQGGGSTPLRVLVITGSIRPVRIGDQITQEVARLATNLGTGPDRGRIEAVVEDLGVRALPSLHESQPPATGGYAHQHSRDWSATITEADAVVFVTPEYNAGYPAALKNAIDHLHSEWQDKPALVLSYGFHGGTRVQRQLSEGGTSLRMRLAPGVEVSVGRQDFDSAGRLQNPGETLARYGPALAAALTQLFELAATSTPGQHLAAA